MRSGTTQHHGTVVTVVGLNEDCIAFGVVAGNVAEGIPKTGSGEFGDGAGRGHFEEDERDVDGQKAKGCYSRFELAENDNHGVEA